MVGWVYQPLHVILVLELRCILEYPAGVGELPGGGGENPHVGTGVRILMGHKASLTVVKE